jgi:AcrR family transcriptional regulator
VESFNFREAQSDSRSRLRTAIIDGAERLLVEHGSSGVTARLLAQQVNASTKVIYSHFGSLSGVIAAVYERAFGQLAQRLEDAAGRSTSRTGQLHNVAYAYRAFALERPRVFALLYGPEVQLLAPSEDDRSAARASLDVIVSLFGKRSTRDAYRFWSAIHGPVVLETTGWLPSDDCLKDALKRFT